MIFKKVVQKLSLEKAKSGTENNSPACMDIYIYIHIEVYTYML